MVVWYNLYVTLNTPCIIHDKSPDLISSCRWPATDRATLLYEWSGHEVQACGSLIFLPNRRTFKGGRTHTSQPVHQFRAALIIPVWLTAPSHGQIL